MSVGNRLAAFRLNESETINQYEKRIEFVKNTFEIVITLTFAFVHCKQP